MQQNWCDDSSSPHLILVFSCSITSLSECCCFCSSFSSEICPDEIRPVSVLESCEGDLVIMAVEGGIDCSTHPHFSHGIGALLAAKLLCVCVSVCTHYCPLSRRMTICIFHKLDGRKLGKLFALQFR